MATQTNGEHRVFQDDSRYVLPKDAPEHERLEKQSQALIALMDDKPFHAPVAILKKILDIGCGTGSMTDLLASKYPDAQVYGVDLAPVPNIGHRNHTNVEYVQGDIRELIGADPRFELGSFDYIFQRLLVFVRIQDWPKYIDSITRLLKPGGWLECHEPSMQMRSSTDERLADKTWWYREIHADATALGIDPEIGDSLLKIFESAPTLENASQAVYPLFPAPEEDKPRLQAQQQQLPALFTVFIRKVSSLNRGEEEADKMVSDLQSTFEKGFKEGDNYPIYAVWGQRK